MLDAHNLSWTEWRGIITIHETCKSLYGHEVTFIFCGVTGNVGVIDSERSDPVSAQLRERLCRLERVEGHRGAAITDALRIIAKRDAPELAESLPKAREQVEKLLTAHEFDPESFGVASRHLVELVHNVGALARGGAKESMESLVDRAVRRIRLGRRRVRGGTAA